MAITMRGRVVNFTGKDAKNLQNLADSLKVTPQEALIQALTYQMNLSKLTPTDTDLKKWEKFIDKYVNTKTIKKEISDYYVYGPVQLDCVNDYWQLCKGEKVLKTFLTRTEAVKEKQKLENKKGKK